MGTQWWNWTDAACTSKWSFSCNSCHGKLNKYIAVSPNTTVNFVYAEQYCLSHYGTHLASVHSDEDMEEANLLCSLLSPFEDCWIGLSDYGRNTNEFYWMDGSQWDYGNNISGGIYPWGIINGNPQPDNIAQNCVSLRSNDQVWGDAGCTDLNYFLCNMPSVWYGYDLTKVWDIEQDKGILYEYADRSKMSFVVEEGLGCDTAWYQRQHIDFRNVVIEIMFKYNAAVHSSQSGLRIRYKKNKYLYIVLIAPYITVYDRMTMC